MKYVCPPGKPRSGSVPSEKRVGAQRAAAEGVGRGGSGGQRHRHARVDRIRVCSCVFTHFVEPAGEPRGTIVSPASKEQLEELGFAVGVRHA